MCKLLNLPGSLHPQHFFIENGHTVFEGNMGQALAHKHIQSQSAPKETSHTVTLPLQPDPFCEFPVVSKTILNIHFNSIFSKVWMEEGFILNSYGKVRACMLWLTQLWGCVSINIPTPPHTLWPTDFFWIHFCASAYRWGMKSYLWPFFLIQLSTSASTCLSMFQGRLESLIFRKDICLNRHMPILHLIGVIKNLKSICVYLG